MQKFSNAHLHGFLKLFYEKCVSVPTYLSISLCVFVRTNPCEQFLIGKCNLCKQNKGKATTQIFALISFGLKVI